MIRQHRDELFQFGWTDGEPATIVAANASRSVTSPTVVSGRRGEQR